MVGSDGPLELGLPWAALGFFSGVEAIPASCSFLLAFASSALSGLWALDTAGAGALDLIVETISPAEVA